jgi:hypothetical protein
MRWPAATELWRNHAPNSASPAESPQRLTNNTGEPEA